MLCLLWKIMFLCSRPSLTISDNTTMNIPATILLYSAIIRKEILQNIISLNLEIGQNINSVSILRIRPSKILVRGEYRSSLENSLLWMYQKSSIPPFSVFL